MNEDVNFKPTLRTPINNQSKNFEKNFTKTMNQNKVKLQEVDEMLNEDELSLKKKIFSLPKMEALVFSDPKLSAKYDEMTEKGNLRYGYHYNETVLNMLFNDFVLNSLSYLEKYKRAVPKEKKRRDKSGIEQLKKAGEEKMEKQRKVDTKEKPIKETTAAASSGAYAGPAAWGGGDLMKGSKSKIMRKPIWSSGTIVAENKNYLIDADSFKNYHQELNEQSDIDFISNNSDAYGNEIKNMDDENLNIIKKDIQTKKMDNANLNSMEEEKNINEKSVSKSQQRFMGLVRAVQKGEKSPNEVGKSVVNVAKTMKEKDVEDFASTKLKDLPEKISEFKEVLNSDIYNDELKQGKTENQAAEYLLDILTNGMWAVWDNDKIEDAKQKIINKYKKVNEDSQTSMVQSNPTSMSLKQTPADQSSMPRGLTTTSGGMNEEHNIKENDMNIFEELNKELEAYEIHHIKLIKMTEDRKPSSLVLKDRLGSENQKNFKSDLNKSGTKEIINVEKELQYKDQQTDVKDPQKLTQQLEKAELKATKGESLKNVGDSANDKGDEIPKRNLTDEEMEEVDKYRLGLGDLVYDNETGKRFEDRMKADMGNKLYNQRQEKLKFRAEAPMYNKDTQPTKKGIEKVQFNKEKSGWNERDGLKESTLTGKYINDLGKKNLFDFELKNVEIVKEDIDKNLFKLDFTGLGNALDGKGNLNEEILNIINTYRFFTDGDKIFAQIKTVNLNENVIKNNDNLDKMNHLLNYKPNNFVNTNNVKINRGF